MGFSALVKSRLAALGYGQKDLARAAQVTDSYISQLLKQKRRPPAQDRTALYGKLETFLRLEPGELGRLVEIERAEEMRRKLGQIPAPLFREFRDLVLRKCVERKRDEVRAVFDAQPFGTLERLVARTLLDVAQRIARVKLDSSDWIPLAASVGGRNPEEMRAMVLEFLDTDLLHISRKNCVACLDDLVVEWDVDLDSLHLVILFNPQLVKSPHRTFTFVEDEPDANSDLEPGLVKFLADRRLDAHVTEEEIRILGRQRFGRRRPTNLYYYRALQNLRDPLHFRDD